MGINTQNLLRTTRFASWLVYKGVLQDNQLLKTTTFEWSQEWFHCISYKLLILWIIATSILYKVKSNYAWFSMKCWDRSFLYSLVIVVQTVNAISSSIFSDLKISWLFHSVQTEWIKSWATEFWTSIFSSIPFTRILLCCKLISKCFLYKTADTWIYNRVDIWLIIEDHQ